MRALSTMAWSVMMDLAGAVLAPRRCAACDARDVSAPFCRPCAETLERARDAPSVDGTTPTLAAFVYGGAVASAISRAKYTDRPDLLPVLAAATRDAVRVPLDAMVAEAAGAAVLVPVPLHRARLAERGYNQAARIAATLSRALGTRHAPRALSRIVDTPRQASLPRRARLDNVSGAFVARAPLDGARVLLVDDVLTTGATLRACARAVSEAGGVMTGCVVVAFAERDGL